MPQIKQTYKLIGIKKEQVIEECRSIFAAMNLINIQEFENNEKEKSQIITGVATSIWGWGGLEMGVRIYETPEGTEFEFRGFVAQLATSPLTGKMDEFLAKLKTILKEKYAYEFEFEKLNTFLPKYDMSLTDIDKKMLIGLLVSGVTALVAQFVIAIKPLSYAALGVFICYLIAKTIYKIMRK